MKSRIPIILAIILLLLAGFYYIYDVRISGKKEERKTEEEHVLEFESGDIAAIELTREKEEISFEKTKDGWKMISPNSVTASSSTINDFLRELHDFKRDKIIEEKPEELAQFGLKPPKYEIKLHTKDSPPKELSLLIGANTPVGNAHYAQAPGNPAVLAITPTISHHLDQPVEGFREKEALPLDADKVTTLHIKYIDREIALESPQNYWTQFRREQPWKMTKPVEAKADKSKVSSLLWDIKGLKIDQFLESNSPADLKEKLQNHTVEVTVSQLGRPPETLIIGEMDREKKNYVCMRQPSGEQFLLKSEVLGKLDKKYEELVDNHIVSFEPPDVNRYEIVTKNLAIEAERSKEEWKLKKPDVKPKKEKKENAPLFPSLGTLIWRVENTRYLEKKKEGGEPAFVKNPLITVAFYNKKKAKLFALYFGEIPGETEKYYVRVEPPPVQDEYYVVGNEVPSLCKTIEDEIKSAQAPPSPTPSPGGATSPSLTPSPGGATSPSPGVPGK